MMTLERHINWKTKLNVLIAVDPIQLEQEAEAS
jgi:hypothetical protein